MNHQEAERRQHFLRGLKKKIDSALESGEQLPLRISKDDLSTLGNKIDLKQDQSVHLFLALNREGYASAKIVGAKQDPFLMAFLYAITDKGLRLIDLLPTESSGQIGSQEYHNNQVQYPSTAKTISRAVTLFYSYSHKDEKHRERLETHLSLLKREGILKEWHDRKITPGQEWEEVLDKNLENSDVIILLVSSDFIASDYCYEREMKRAIERHDKGEATVVPIIVRPCDWKGTPFSKLQALPKDAKPITKWNDKDDAWLDVTKGIRKAISRR